MTVPKLTPDTILDSYKQIDYTPAQEIYIDPDNKKCCGMTAFVIAHFPDAEARLIATYRQLEDDCWPLVKGHRDLQTILSDFLEDQHIGILHFEKGFDFNEVPKDSAPFFEHMGYETWQKIEAWMKETAHA